MPLRHYDGPLLPAVPGESGNTPPDAPSSASPTPAPPPRPPAANAAPESQVSPPATFPPEMRGVMVTVQGAEPGSPEVTGVGPTIEAAIEAARAKWEAEHVLPLMWADGRPVEGLARQVLIESLELFVMHASLEPGPRQMVGKIQRALGAEEG